MKKVGFGLVLGLALVVGGWLGVREVTARSNADQYLTAHEIPTYHMLSFHGRGDLNALGYCRPCGEKARDVLRDRTEKELEKTKSELESILSGGRK